jgi:hypothetical protein
MSKSFRVTLERGISSIFRKENMPLMLNFSMLAGLCMYVIVLPKLVLKTVSVRIRMQTISKVHTLTVITTQIPQNYKRTNEKIPYPPNSA